MGLPKHETQHKTPVEFQAISAYMSGRHRGHCEHRHPDHQETPGRPGGCLRYDAPRNLLLLLLLSADKADRRQRAWRVCLAE
jgi:hypothetical protein